MYSCKHTLSKIQNTYKTRVILAECSIYPYILARALAPIECPLFCLLLYWWWRWWMNDDVYGKNIVLDHNWLAQFSTDFSKILINISRRWWHFSPTSYHIIALVQRFIPTVFKLICKRDVLPRSPTRTSKELQEEDQLWPCCSSSLTSVMHNDFDNIFW